MTRPNFQPLNSDASLLAMEVQEGWGLKFSSSDGEKNITHKNSLGYFEKRSDDVSRYLTENRGAQGAHKLARRRFPGRDL
ncbi:MAG: hypothetical protein GY847_11185 [Proteobacteria bacterium]|nr:hypothetical protein [Pseudomonadota bacterium]